MHKFSESISVKAGSNFPCYIKFRPKLSCFLGQEQELKKWTLFHKVKKFLSKGIDMIAQA